MSDEEIADWTPPAQLMNINHPCQPVNGPRITQLLIATTPYTFNETAGGYFKLEGVAFSDTDETVSAPFSVSVDGSDFTVLDFVAGDPCFTFTIYAPLSVVSTHLFRIPYSTGVKSAVRTTVSPPAVSPSSSTTASTTTSSSTRTSSGGSQTATPTQSSPTPSPSSASSTTTLAQTSDVPHDSSRAAVIAPAVTVPIVVLAGIALFILLCFRRRRRRRDADDASTMPYGLATSSVAPTSPSVVPTSPQDRKLAALGKTAHPSTVASTSEHAQTPSTSVPTSSAVGDGEEEHVRELASAMRNAGLTTTGLFSLLRRPSRNGRGDPDAEHDAETLPGYHA